MKRRFQTGGDVRPDLQMLLKQGYTPTRPPGMPPRMASEQVFGNSSWTDRGDRIDRPNTFTDQADPVELPMGGKPGGSVLGQMMDSIVDNAQRAYERSLAGAVTALRRQLVPQPAPQPVNQLPVRRADGGSIRERSSSMSPNGGAPPTGGAQQGAFVAGAPGNSLGAAPGLNPAAIQQQLAQRRSLAAGPPAAAGFPATQGMPMRPPMPPQGMPPGAAMPPGAGMPPSGAMPPGGTMGPLPPGAGMPPGGGAMGPLPPGAMPPQGMPPGGAPPNPQVLAALMQARGAAPPVTGMARGGRVKGGFRAGAAEDIPQPRKKVAAVKRRKPPALAAPPPPPPSDGPPDTDTDIPPTAPPGVGPPPMGAPPPGMKKGGKWIQAMHMKKGALHKQLGVPEDKNIPKKMLAKAAEKGGKLGKRARVAETLDKVRKAKGGACKKMAAGGAMKVRRGFPNVQPAPKKYAAGGKIRGCGAATKGTRFQGIF